MSKFTKSTDDFDSSTYVKVNDRLSEFRNIYPEGRITVFRTETKSGVSFKAIICKDKDDAELFAATSIAPATGHSFLPNSLQGEKVEEYSETVAIGRALAVLGLKVEKSIASAEEMVQFNRVQEAETTVEKVEEEGDSTAPPDVKLKPSRFFAGSSKFKNNNGE
jgi:hypothetical protein